MYSFWAMAQTNMDRQIDGQIAAAAYNNTLLGQRWMRGKKKLLYENPKSRYKLWVPGQNIYEQCENCTAHIKIVKRKSRKFTHYMPITFRNRWKVFAECCGNGNVIDHHYNVFDGFVIWGTVRNFSLVFAGIKGIWNLTWGLGILFRG